MLNCVGAVLCRNNDVVVVDKFGFVSVGVGGVRLGGGVFLRAVSAGRFKKTKPRIMGIF